MEEMRSIHSVMPYSGASSAMGNSHDHATRSELGRRIARLCNAEFLEAGRNGFGGAAATGAGLFWIPNDVLTREEAAELGISRADQLFGGVVPRPFVGTKIVSHGLLADNAAAPPGWAHGLAARLADAVLRGFSVFSAADARAAGRLLLAHGPIRLKDVKGTAGKGQTVVATGAELDRAIADIPPPDLAGHGLVIEQNLEDVVTYSVGTVSLFGQTIAYWGTQRLTLDNHGEVAYGGSQLHCVRGGFAALKRQLLAPELAEAVDKAARYDRAMFGAYPGLFASRRNYDVALGRDGQGRQRIGVLEQSWRAGGASGAEMLAFEAFAAQPDRAAITCATVEVYGDVDAAPPEAALYYSGVDPVVGPLSKYAVEL